MCGEHIPSIDHVEHHLGIIPACAGSTYPLLGHPLSIWDHPRMCGEHGRAHHRRLLLLGSSPHVRGAHSVTYACFPTPGIIPACAGSTCLIRSLRLHRRDHPRMCGEHDVEAGQFKGYVGSSPHVRGAPLSRPSSSWNYGIIPACAGSTKTV